MSNIVADVATLSTIPEKTLNKLIKKVIYCSAQAVKEDCIADKSISELDIGIGVIYIKHYGSEIKYKFVPEENFRKVIEETVNGELNLLEDALNESLVNKFTKIYKDLC